MDNKNRKENQKHLLLLTGAVFLLTVFDQWTKWLAVQYLKDGEPFVLIKNVFELTYLENRGAAFGLFQNQRSIFLLITAAVMAVVLYAYWKLPKNRRYLPLRIICAGILAGAVGNMIDRVCQGYVVDFFYFRLINFPVFNVADIYVTVSASLFVLLLIFYYKEEEFDFLVRKTKNAGQDGE